MTKRNKPMSRTPLYHTMRLLRVPLVKWGSEIEKIPPAAIQDLERAACNVAVHAARLSGYLDARGATGCGDNGHADGVKESNRKVAKVRKALGFTQAKDDVRF